MVRRPADSGRKDWVRARTRTTKKTSADRNKGDGDGVSRRCHGALHYTVAFERRSQSQHAAKRLVLAKALEYLRWLRNLAAEMETRSRLAHTLRVGRTGILLVRVLLGLLVGFVSCDLGGDVLGDECTNAILIRPFDVSVLFVEDLDHVAGQFAWCPSSPGEASSLHQSSLRHVSRCWEWYGFRVAVPARSARQSSTVTQLSLAAEPLKSLRFTIRI